MACDEVSGLVCVPDELRDILVLSDVTCTNDFGARTLLPMKLTVLMEK